MIEPAPPNDAEPPLLDQDEWHFLIESPQLQQGDFVRNLRLYVQDIPESTEGTPDVPYEDFPLTIIISQSCDLVLGRDDTHGVLCPVYMLTDYTAQNISLNKIERLWEKARKSEAINHFPLNACTIREHTRGPALVDLTRIFEVPLRRLVEFATTGPRVRLKSPYREHLAQHFARKVMRIAPPLPVPEWKVVKPA